MQEGAWTRKPTYCTRWAMLPDFRDREAAKGQCLTHLSLIVKVDRRRCGWFWFWFWFLVLVRSAPRPDG